MSQEPAAAGRQAVGSEIGSFAEAAAGDVENLALLHDREPTREILEALRACAFEDQLSVVLRRSETAQALRDLDQAIAALPETLDDDVLDDLAAEYAYVYLRFTYRASPTESVWFDDDGIERQAPMFQVRTWYRRYDLAVRDWASRPDDHLVLQLKFLAHLLAKAQERADLEDVGRFMDQHILRWIGLFADQLQRAGAAPLFAGFADVTRVYLEELRDHVEDLTGLARPTGEEAAPLSPETVVEDAPQSYVPGAGPSW